MLAELARKRKPQQSQEESALFRAIGRPALSGLASVGNLLDLATGASSVRDALAGENPFDQFLTPFSHENRVTGRELGEQWGLLRKNKETGISGWLDDPSEALHDVGGFGLELALDPATWVTGGAMAAIKPAANALKGTKVGRAVANSTVGRAVGGAIGASKRLGRRMFDARAMDKATEVGQQAASREGGLFDQRLAAEQSANAATKPVASMMEGAGVYDEAGRKLLRDRLEGVGTGKYETVLEPGDVEDFLTITRDGERVAGISHGRVKWSGMQEDLFRKAFPGVDPNQHIRRVGGVQAFERGQGHGSRAYLEAMAQHPDAWFWNNQATADAMKALRKMEADGLIELRTYGDMSRGGGAQKLMRITEKGKKAVAAPHQGVRDEFIGRMADQLRPELAAVRAEAGAAGLANDYLDDVIDFAYRRMSAATKEAYESIERVGAGKVGRSVEGAAKRRQDVWKGFRRGTNHVDEVLKDGDLGGIVERGAAAGRTKSKVVKDVRDAIEAKFGDDIDPTYILRDDAGKRRFVDETGKGWKLGDETFGKLEDLGDGTYRWSTTTKFGKEPVERILTPKLADRYEDLARVIVDQPEIRANGLFGNNPLEDIAEGLTQARQRIANAEFVQDVLGKVAKGQKPQYAKLGERATTVGDVLKANGIKSDAGARRLADTLGIAVPEKDAAKVLRDVRRMVVPDDVAADLMAASSKFELPKALDTPAKFAKGFTSMFKAGVLTWPARYVRDATSGLVRNVEAGLVSPMTAVQSGMAAHKIIQGRAVNGLAEVPAVRQWLERTGREVSDETASRAVAEMYASLKASPQFQNTESLAAGGILQDVPGALGRGLDPKAMVRKFIGKDGASLNPFDIAGVGGRESTTFGPAAVGDIAGRYTDNLNRLTPFIDQLKRGNLDLDGARKVMADIERAQVGYAPRNFTPTEKVLRQIFPFYSFSSRQIPYVVGRLWDNPGGALGKMIRAQRLAASNNGKPLPEHIAQTGGIPLGTMEDGTQRYIAGLGLMHEDTLALLGGGFQGALTELGSRSNPLIKGAIETATGESLFQRGPMGGRDLVDIDPTLGRTVSNISETLGAGPIEDASGRAIPIGGMLGEHAFANSPLSRAGSTLRTLTDPRKREPAFAFPGDALMMNLLTGARVSDISPAAQDAVARDQASAMAREMGAKSYETVFFSQDVIRETAKTDPETAQRMEAFNALRNLLARKSKARAAEGAR